MREILEAGERDSDREMVAEAEQLGAVAVIEVNVDYAPIQIRQGGSMLMGSASGIAIKL